MHHPLIPRVPDDWTVWAFSDPHGVATGFEAALVRAGLLDHELRWVAPRRTALVGCGARTFHEGRSLGIDTNACGSPQMPPRARKLVTLVELAGEVALEATRRVVVATDDAPDRARSRRR